VRSTTTWLYYNAEHIRLQIVDMIDGAPAEIRTVVLDFSSVPAIDITAAMILRGLLRTVKDRGIRVEIAELRDEVVEQLKLIGAENELGSLVAHRTIDDCLAGR
jgi:MFS superfamily sulfate permease-like transporter